MVPPSVISGAASLAMRMNEWQETSIALAKPSAEQLSSPPCRSSFGANAVEHGLQLPGNRHVQRAGDRRGKLLRQRLHEAPRALVQPGDGKIRSHGTECLGTAVSDRLVIGDADHERLLPGENRSNAGVAHGAYPG
jgi:hypothetical protein